MEQDKLETEFQKWDALISKNMSFKERLEQVQFDHYITTAINEVKFPKF